MKKEVNKGKELARGLYGRPWLDSVEGQRRKFFEAIVLDMICIVMFILYYEKIIVNTDPKNNMIMLGVLIIFIISIIATYIYNPNRWDILDILYENGLSGIGAPFAYYSEVEMIAYGRKPHSGKRFLQIFIKGRSWQKSPTYVDGDYINDFFERAIEILKEKCPDVPWVEMEWQELKRKGR